jgi:DNA (cytosine-5)-methyltransferase 1
MRTLRACDYGAPTIRKRLFVIARCDGEPIVWPEPTHGPGRPTPYRIAAECIDWSIPCPSIFGRKKPLADKTLRRIARGIDRYVLGAAEPFLIPVTHAGDDRAHSIRQPMRTITGAHRGEHALVAPTLIQTSWGERAGQAPRALDLHRPLGTVVAGGVKHALVAAFLAKHFGGHEATGSRLSDPVSTVTAKDHHALVTSHLVKLYGSSKVGRPLTEPMPTVTANGRGGGHLAEVRAFLIAYYGTDNMSAVSSPLPTATSRARFGLVTVQGVDYAIVDIGMRMLAPPELFLAQGFPPDYDIAPIVNGKPLSKTAQTDACGNAVCPPLAAALVAANMAQRAAKRRSA